MARNTRAKIKRTHKKYGIDFSSEFLPLPIEALHTRELFNEWKGKLESFTNPHNQNYQFVKNKYGVVTSKSDITKITLKNKRAIRLAEQQIKKVENTITDEGITVGEYSERFANPSDVHGISVPSEFKFEDVRSVSRLNTIREASERKSNVRHYDTRMDDMKENYILMLERALGSDSDEIVNKIKNLDGETFYDLYLSYKSFDFNLWYPSDEFFDEDENTQQVTKMLHDMERYARKNKDLKSFPNG